VSAWEDELLREQDFTGAPAVDVGLRARLAPARDLGWFGLVAGVHHTWFVGYRGPVADAAQLRGLSASLGVHLGP